MARTIVRRGGRWMVLALAAALAAGAGAQPPAAEAPPPPEERDARPAESREVMRQRLQRRLESVRALETQLEDSIKRLDAGETPEAVRGQMDRNRPPREGRPDGPPLGGPPMSGPGGEGGPPPGPGGRLVLMEMIERYQPALAERIRQAMREDPETTRRVLERLEPQARELAVERDPELRDLRAEDLRNSFETLGRLRRIGEAMRPGAPAGELAAEEAALRVLLGEKYDLQAAINAKLITRLEARLASLREQTQTQGGGRDAFVEAQARRMLENVRQRAESAPQGPRRPRGPGKGEGKGEHRGDGKADGDRPPAKGP